MNHLRHMLALLLGVLWLVSGVSLLWAQQSAPDWAEPINLSQSGGTTNPVLVMDNEGDLHVIWQDNFAEAYVYQYNEGGIWQTPVTVTFPFTATVPRFVIDGNDRLHAFWRYADGEDDTSVRYSSVPVTAVTSLDAWAPVQMVADSAADLDVGLDEQGELHLLYARTMETENAPAGVYHRYTAPDVTGVQTWLTPTLLYESPYFRGVSDMDAHVDLVTAVSGGDSWLFAAWDNRPRKQVFFTRSSDGGKEWQLPVEIEGPVSGSSIVSPFNISIGVKGENVLLVWNRGTPDLSCQQYSISSPDLGETWGEQRLMDDLLPGTANCVTLNEFVVGTDLLYLLSTVQSQRFMWAWDGSQWSPPVLQPILTSFENSQTLNSVAFRCQQSIGIPDNQLLVIGCEEDVRGFGDGDIWLLSRPLGSHDDWFLPATAWQPVELVNSSSDAYHSLALVPVGNGDFLAFWTYADGSGNAQPSIIAARWSEGRWLLPEIVFSVPRTQIASPLAVATSPSGQLYITWADSVGQLYLAQTALSEAHIASSWSPMTEVSLERPAGSPAIAVDEDGTLYLAYTVSVNEGRGVYLLTSTDNGRTWSDPLIVFDGVAAGWEVVGPARMAVTDTGEVHFLGAQQSLLAGGRPQTQALYYSHSVDSPQGPGFAPATLVTEGLITWSDLVTSDAQTIHQFWRNADAQTVVIEHTYSVDNGASWNQPDLIDTTAGQIAVTDNETGVVSLLTLEDTAVNEWRWQQGRWIKPTGISLENFLPANPDEQKIAASLSSTGVLVTLFTGQAVDVDDMQITYNTLHASSRAVDDETDLPSVIPIEPDIVTPTVTPVSETATTMPPTPTNQLVTSTTATPTTNTPGELPANNLVSDLVFGIVPVALLVFIVFGIGFLTVRRRSR